MIKVKSSKKNDYWHLTGAFYLVFVLLNNIFIFTFANAPFKAKTITEYKTTLDYTFNTLVRILNLFLTLTEVLQSI